MKILHRLLILHLCLGLLVNPALAAAPLESETYPSTAPTSCTFTIQAITPRGDTFPKSPLTEKRASEMNRETAVESGRSAAKTNPFAAAFLKRYPNMGKVFEESFIRKHLGMFMTIDPFHHIPENELTQFYQHTLPALAIAKGMQAVEICLKKIKDYKDISRWNTAIHTFHLPTVPDNYIQLEIPTPASEVLKQPEIIDGISWDTYETSLDENGNLQFGGGRLLVNGSKPSQPKAWARFGKERRNQKIKLFMKDDVIHRCLFLETGIPEEFVLIWSKSRHRYISSYWGELTEAEFNLLDEDMELHNFHLPPDGQVSLGGRLHWMRFDKTHAGRAIRLFDLRHSEGRTFITAGEVIDNGIVVASKHLRVLYETDAFSAPESFALGRLVDVFEKEGDDMILPNGNVLRSYIITDVKLDSEGAIKIGRFRRRLKTLKRGVVDLKVINNERRFVKPRFRSDATPVLGPKGQSVLLDLRNVDGSGKVRWPLLREHSLSSEPSVPEAWHSWHLRGIPTATLGEQLISLSSVFRTIPEQFRSFVGPKRWRHTGNQLKRDA